MSSQLKQPDLAWWELRFSCSDPDDLAAALIVEGAGGAIINDEHHITCYYQSDSVSKDAFIAKARKLGATLVAEVAVEEKNWVQSCPDVCQELQVEGIRIIPLTDVPAKADPRGTASDKILLIPGTGFGTGHHATTAMMLRILQLPEIKSLAPKHVLDVGTGSGILAVAAWKLFAAEVTATDNDPLALENAKINIALNACEKYVQISAAAASNLTGSFALIVANIYAEVLQALRPDFERLLAPGGALALSGIMLPLAAALQRDFEKHGWESTQRLDSEGWVSLLLRRKSKIP
jgi:ribosomal protein L11 methyltransferase